jgi:hypothetical protein
MGENQSTIQVRAGARVSGSAVNALALDLSGSRLSWSPVTGASVRFGWRDLPEQGMWLRVSQTCCWWQALFGGRTDVKFVAAPAVVGAMSVAPSVLPVQLGCFVEAQEEFGRADGLSCTCMVAAKGENPSAARGFRVRAERGQERYGWRLSVGYPKHCCSGMHVPFSVGSSLPSAGREACWVKFLDQHGAWADGCYTSNICSRVEERSTGGVYFGDYGPEFSTEMVNVDEISPELVVHQHPGLVPGQCVP